MGYKLAGYRSIGGVEIDPEMMRLYRANMKPDHSYLMDVRSFLALPDSRIPEELRGLDVLDGSPPCSSFSSAGLREKGWGRAKRFREGQAVQVLDDLFGVLIGIAGRLRPKAVIAENVKGMIMGKAKGYVREVFSGFRASGYQHVNMFLLNAASMGVPQARERVFFVASRIGPFTGGIDSFAPKHGPAPATVRQALEGVDSIGEPLNARQSAYWSMARPGKGWCRSGTKNSVPDMVRLDPSRPAPTQTATRNLVHWASPSWLSPLACARVQSFPDDYDFLDSDPAYVCGMSVPPHMMRAVSFAVRRHLLEPGAHDAANRGGQPQALAIVLPDSQDTPSCTPQTP